MTIATLPEPISATQSVLQLADQAAPLRILHLLPALYGGGMERATMNLIRGFTRRQEQGDADSATAHGVCVFRGGNDQLLAEFQSLAPTWVLDDRPSHSKPGRRWMRGPLGKIIDELNPDIVHARSTGIWFDAATAMFGRHDRRLLLSFHGVTELTPPNWRRRQMNRWATRRADAVLAVSHESARMMHRKWGVPEHKLYTVPNGVDIQRFRPADDKTRHTIRRDLDLEPEGHVVLCVANLLPIKAIDVLLEAWRKVSMIDPSARLLIAGDGPLREKLHQLAQRLRCETTVRFLGSRGDVPHLLQAADLFALPSKYECSSNATLEAMASGLPVVAFDVGGMRELIEPHYTGWLVPLDQPHEFAQTMVAALLDRTGRQRISRAARQRIVDNFCTQCWVDHYASVYQHIAEGEWMLR